MGTYLAAIHNHGGKDCRPKWWVFDTFLPRYSLAQFVLQEVTTGEILSFREETTGN